MSYRIGQGYDAHQLGDKLPLILGGVSIPHNKGVVAHSDGDILIHSMNYLSNRKNLKEAAKKLYKTLSMIKKKKFKSIAVEKIPSVGFGEVRNDRLIRASKF